jgi:hypothetical protein
MREFEREIRDTLPDAFAALIDRGKRNSKEIRVGQVSTSHYRQIFRDA